MHRIHNSDNQRVDAYDKFKMRNACVRLYKSGDALAIVTGVNSYEQMLEKPVVAASVAAQALGVRIGMSGKEALLCMR